MKVSFRILLFALSQRSRYTVLLAATLLLACGESSSGGAHEVTASDAAQAGAGTGVGGMVGPAGPAVASAADGGAHAGDAGGVTTITPTADASRPDVLRPDAAVQPDAARPTTPSTSPTACAGKALPPRALGKLPPFAVGPESAGLPAYWPTAAWRKEDPEKLGFDATALLAAVAFSSPNANTQAVFVVRHGYVAAEAYSGGFTATTRHESFSMAKSFTSGLIGIALAEGKLQSLDERLCSVYPMQWDCAASSDPRSRITIEHAMNLTTGLEWKEDWRTTATSANDALSLTMLDDTLAKRSVAEPGTEKRYSTGDPALLAGVLQKATGMTPLQYAKQKIFDVIGTPDVVWNAELLGRPATYAYVQATASEYAKYGYLYLRRGLWDGKQVIPGEWIDRTTYAKNPCEDWNQYLWHVNPPVRLGQQDPGCDSLYCPPIGFADLPRDAFFAEGVFGQFIFVIPSADLVVVRLGDDAGGLEDWDAYGRGLLGAVLAAIR